MKPVSSPRGRIIRTASNLEHVPIEHEEWWRETVRYSKFNRQGIDIVCASFEHRKPKGVIIFVTGWSESFLKYPDLIRTLFSHQFSVYTYDHQSQGLSGRWLSESQSTWVHSFDDYVDDFVFFMTMISRQCANKHPMNVVGHSMGCLIAAIGMSRHPSLVNRAVFSAPLIRNKCALKSLDYGFPIPFPLAYWSTSIACYFGMGNMHAMGFFKEKPDDKITQKLTHDPKQMRNWELLRQRYPSIISSCVTNNWVLTTMRAQIKFAYKYELFRTNTLILQASDDIFVHNRAQDMFAQKAPNCRILEVPESYHDVLLETPDKRNACVRAMVSFFEQEHDDVGEVRPVPPLVSPGEKQIFQLPELVIRATGLTISAFGFILGVSLMLGGRGQGR
mmetsp:Transcript_22059/g.37350  ORF Transcript_22059/g.37350 Transcript_22059/m.37350 type:complete len:390 (+) Transcript_22059:136-1305(+)|eukprot:CAMPEP_0114413178 /NCGR_PEP_ID=MMETSP0103-20121206/718_1 /TAXON_ID=37642 ORGANISM="Paraphysomonas imperforata, Strain PA2" /NCGR_SAMPLE_ID=MMETSP0103 /ASSEMBLY_ACC=CAM_ASM_000201 /LENGTH=389 /DNA_ID=CAMNT_0001581239 /DNA_START=75 /DNA_END=1244 /DNA_ORIENTATION=+